MNFALNSSSTARTMRAVDGPDCLVISNDLVQSSKSCQILYLLRIALFAHCKDFRLDWQYLLVVEEMLQIPI